MLSEVTSLSMNFPMTMAASNRAEVTDADILLAVIDARTRPADMAAFTLPADIAASILLATIAADRLKLTGSLLSLRS